MKKIFYLAAILIIGLFQACKKDKANNNNNGTVSVSDMLKDSVYLYEKEDYIWNDVIPSYSAFNPRSYTGSTDIIALSNELYAITKIKINPTTGKPYEYNPNDPGNPKYSFVDDGTTTASLNGTNGDFGFAPIYIAVNDLRIKYVYPGSPAALAGVTRGDQITSINGSTSISYDGGTNVNNVVQAVYYSSTIKLGLVKLDGTTGNVTLNTTSYTVNPVLTYKVFNNGKVGYLAFNSFTTLANAKPKLDEAFTYFISKGITDLVVDLRYNGGGAGETAAYLDDLIAPSSSNNKLMYTTFFNAGLQSNNYPLLAKKFNISPGDFLPQNNQVNFAKALTLNNLGRVFFIVTNETASSSELTINNLRPAFKNNLQLVGDTTYGKPVGEIPIPIGKYILYSPQLSVENSDNQGDYYTGMAPGSASYPGKLAGDDVTKDFGDSTETLLAHALSYVKTGTYALKGPQIQSLSQSTLSLHQQATMAHQLNPHKFKGLVFKKSIGKIKGF